MQTQTLSIALLLHFVATTLCEDDGMGNQRAKSKPHILSCDSKIAGDTCTFMGKNKSTGTAVVGTCVLDKGVLGCKLALGGGKGSSKGKYGSGSGKGKRGSGSSKDMKARKVDEGKKKGKGKRQTIVKAEVELVGIYKTEFDETAQNQFKEAIASGAGAVCGQGGAEACSATDVEITRMQRRAVSVVYILKTQTETAAAQAAATLGTYTASAAFLSTLQAAGGSLGNLVNVQVTENPVVEVRGGGDDDSDNTTKFIIAATVAGVMLVLCCIGMVFFCRRGSAEVQKVVVTDVEMAQGLSTRKGVVVPARAIEAYGANNPPSYAVAVVVGQPSWPAKTITDSTQKTTTDVAAAQWQDVPLK